MYPLSRNGVALSLLFTSSLSFGAEKSNKQMQAVLDELGALKGKPIETLSPEEARKQPSPDIAVKNLMTKKNIQPPKSTVTTQDIEIDGASGKIAARVYKPGNKTNLPLVVYYHGGGFVIATNDTYDATPRSLSQMTDAIWLSVEYRKAPENKFPAAHDDAFAAYQWALKNAASLGADPKRIAVAGESAGGNLALNVAIMARDKGVPLPLHEVLVYPVAGNDMNTASYRDNADAKPLNKPMMAWFVKHYTRTEADTKDPRINLLAADLKGLNPATIITAQVDPLRSEGKELARKLEEAKVKVKYKNYEGVAHEFFGMATVVDEAKDAQDLAADELKDALKANRSAGR
ncbi:MAG: alpha/beta hydrolase [Proteobacteria bacterium]|nr:MAG: alpha/beta hydrolase [Pseudomonadota bacterium]